MLINATDLTGYNYCARKLFLKLVLRIKEPPSKQVLIGRLLHEFLEKMNGEEEKMVKSLVDKESIGVLRVKCNDCLAEILKDLIIKNQYDLMDFELGLAENYRNLWSMAKTLIDERIALIEDTHRSTDKIGNDLWAALQPKLIAEHQIADKELQLKGRIDQIEDFGNVLLPREIKSGKAPLSGAWKDHQLQLASYALLLESKWKRPINKGVIYYLGSSQKIEQPINPFLKEEVKELIEKVQLMLEKKELPAYVENKNKCINCGVREQCYNEKLLQRVLKKQENHSMTTETE